MAYRTRATLTQIALLLLVLSPALIFSRADELTGMAQDDPKDLTPNQPASSSCATSGFLPLPYWARDVVMSPLPEVLKPMGRKAVLTTPPVPAPAPLAPPRDSATPTVVVARPTVVTPAPNPALIAVSPFLDWIKANPQAAAEQARQQAGAYQAPVDASAAASTPTPNAAPNNTTGPIVTTPAPYWMPPLIDAAPFTSSTGTSGSSAAIYSTPQR